MLLPVMLCFPLVSYVFLFPPPLLSMFFSVFPCPLFSIVFPCFPCFLVFPTVFTRFSLFSYSPPPLPCFLLFSPVAPCFYMLLRVFLCFPLFSCQTIEESVTSMNFFQNENQSFSSSLSAGEWQALFMWEISVGWNSLKERWLFQTQTHTRFHNHW